MRSTPDGDTADTERAWARSVTALCAGLLVLGFAARVAPLFDHGGRLLQMFPTEDAYLLLTVARNLALGRGMSVSEGTIPTNDVQPLAALLWAGCFWLVEGVKRSGVALVLAMEMLLGAAAALGLERLARLALADTRRPGLAAALAASAWWASPVAIPHAMNALETQMYAASVLFAASLFVAPGTESAWPLRRQLGFGCALGVCFLARCDAALWVVGAGLVHLFRGIEGRRWPVTRRFAETLGFGTVSLAIAAPWLAFNYFKFGSAVPMDGSSTQLDLQLAQSLARVPTALVEFALLVAPIPRAVRELPLVAAAAALACGGGLVAAALAFRGADARRRALIALAAFFTLSLAAVYGLFGDDPAVERHLYPASPFLALVSARAAIALAARLGAARLTGLVHALAGGAFALAAAGALSAYRAGDAHPHFPVVRWVEANVGTGVWVGARQSGTLGFFHDRTLSFDGRVNPQALEARRRGELVEYIAKKRVPYIADGVEAVELMREAPIRARYEVLVNDPEQNLGVLRLRHAPPAEPESGQPDTPE